MDISFETALPDQRRLRPQDESMLGFGKIYSDHMFCMDWTKEKGWKNARVVPFQPFSLSPAALVLHYGQAVFEGFKVFRNQKEGLNVFRPWQHWERFNRSTARLSLPELPVEVGMQALTALLAADGDWTPHSDGTALYVRPFMLATEPYIGLKSTNEALFCIFTSPVGAYYPEGFNPVKIQVCEQYTRSSQTGLGAAKTPANYAASLLAEQEAQNAGYTQVLWLDAREGKYVEEVGSMNIFFKIDGTVITPPLGGSILAGITRKSVLQLLSDWNIPAEERTLSMDDFVSAHQAGKVEEVFGVGTAAVISPVQLLEYRQKAYSIADGGVGPVAERLFDTLTGIQYGRIADPHQWIHSLPCADPTFIATATGSEQKAQI